ncbi:hypothetical protein TOPH_06162 [Tolypocladium ophioglossoides CBS 100239]|uniref:Uncharacterized protein n=1 Tax=Tolypocladium ophioglossoides (strain CBS 100239) TaxID=1163406 RepID=A0A0L0N524_TOLOC|nr:hypothetical protein TOPH_06162 [Tolypocladium ophioglossoides CBS 100239]
MYLSTTPTMAILLTTSPTRKITLWQLTRPLATKNVIMSAETTSIMDNTPVNQAAGSSRCAKEGCDNWCVANSRFCKDHQG